MKKKIENLQEPQKRYIELRRDDLQRKKYNLPINKITYHDFKSDVLSPEDINKAELIVFIDGEEIRELKNRYATW